MKTYEFSYLYEDYEGTVEAEVSEEEIELMRIALRNAFQFLEDDSDLDGIRERVFQLVSEEVEDAENAFIQILFPLELVEEVEAEE